MRGNSGNKIKKYGYKNDLNCVMNFLAHAYLSFGNEPILVGNMISDFVKGKKKFDFPLDIQKGITLHRMIDTYTDSHPSTKAAMRLFRPAAGAYAGPGVLFFLFKI
jgi:acyl carrier protein phosphodiesterase